MSRLSARTPDGAMSKLSARLVYQMVPCQSYQLGSCTRWCHSKAFSSCTSWCHVTFIDSLCGSLTSVRLWCSHICAERDVKLHLTYDLCDFIFTIHWLSLLALHVMLVMCVLERHWRRPKCCCPWIKACLTWTTSGAVAAETDLSCHSPTRLAPVPVFNYFHFSIVTLLFFVVLRATEPGLVAALPMRNSTLCYCCLVVNPLYTCQISASLVYKTVEKVVVFIKLSS